MTSPSLSDDDARDAHLLETGQSDRLLAKYQPAILARCIARAGVLDGEDVAQDVVFRLLRELDAGKRYLGVSRAQARAPTSSPG